MHTGTQVQLGGTVMEYTAVVRAGSGSSYPFLITTASADGTPDLGRVVFDPVMLRGTDEAGEYLPRLGWTAHGGGWEAGSGLVWRRVVPMYPRCEDGPSAAEWAAGI
jgi:hypothetical protein